MKSELAPLIPSTPGWLGKNQLPFHGKYHGKGMCFAGSQTRGQVLTMSFAGYGNVGKLPFVSWT